MGCFDLDTVTKDTIDDVADCYEQTIVVDDYYAIVLDKNCMDLALLSTPPPLSEDVESEDVVIDSTPVVAIPTDVGWELIATLRRNPLDPGMFYIFPEENEAISKAYEAGKHFIFEIGYEFNEGWDNVIRHYIIQPEVPFQDHHKVPYVIWDEEEEGTKWHIHNYTFLSEGWYATAETLIGEVGVGLGVEFRILHIDWPAEFPFPAVKRTDYGSKIGVIDSSGLAGRSNSAIDREIRLRIYVSRD